MSVDFYICEICEETVYEEYVNTLNIQGLQISICINCIEKMIENGKLLILDETENDDRFFSDKEYAFSSEGKQEMIKLFENQKQDIVTKIQKLEELFKCEWCGKIFEDDRESIYEVFIRTSKFNKYQNRDNGSDEEVTVVDDLCEECRDKLLKFLEGNSIEN